ncbi:MAG: hypothetical protein JO174_03700 [Herbaspirillum sp.]|nr:hypothetical protein [Herbaspirillum sp.]
MKWENLIKKETDEVAAGSVFRVKAEWPYEEIVDFMLVYLPSENSTHTLVVCTGMKAGRVLVRLPLEADCGGRAISKDWLVRKWGEWIYPECLVEDVQVARHYEIGAVNRIGD